MKKLLNKKIDTGITLIALVITIVVLIILATVVINLSLGDNGIFDRAREAKEQYQNAEGKEMEDIAKVANEMDMFSTRNALSKQVVLYENDNPSFTIGNITLNQNIDNFNRFTVYCYIGIPKYSKYFEIYEKEKNILLDAGYSGANGYYRDANIVLYLPETGNTANIVRASLEQNGSWFDQCDMTIYKIVGYTD